MMAERLFQSQFGRTKTGYRWIQAVPWPNQDKRYPGWFLTDGEPWSEPPPQEWYDPLHDNQELFLKFARIDYFQDSKGALLPEIDPDCQTPNSIRAFANRYGLLTRWEMIEIPEGPLTSPLLGESRFFWEEQIREMKLAVSMWEMLSPRIDKRRLQQVIRWQSDDVVFYDPSGRWEKNTMASWKPIIHLGFPYYPPNSPPNLKKGDYERAAWCYLANAVNQSLAPVERNPQRLLSPRLVFEQHHPIRVGLRFAPHTLLGAMWLQFAQAIGQGREYRKCLFCGGEFIVGSGSKRNKKRQYCKNSCRVMDCLKRQAKQPSRSKKRKLKAA